jgi:hypothetical protein
LKVECTLTLKIRLENITGKIELEIVNVFKWQGNKRKVWCTVVPPVIRRALQCKQWLYKRVDLTWGGQFSSTFVFHYLSGMKRDDLWWEWYVIKFVSDMLQVSGFLGLLWCPLPI